MKEKFTNISKNLFSKIKNSKKNTIISVVALVQCVILLGVMTYSWIESASSLIIKGNDMPISSNLNYRFDIVDGSTNMVEPLEDWSCIIPGT